MDLKECRNMDDKKEILQWIATVIKGLETTKWIATDDFSFVESKGWWVVIDLDVIKNHLSTQAELMNKLVDKINKLKKRDQKMMKKVMNADADQQNIVFEEYKVDHPSPDMKGGNENLNFENGSWTETEQKDTDSKEESWQIVDNSSSPDQKELKDP